MNRNNVLGYVKSHCLEFTVFFIYVALLITIGLYHEPWFDEFQSWGISKDSIYNILFVIPHYEGHPPLWHLILKCFSAFNVPAEIGLRIPNILFISAAIWLLIFKSPFKRIYRLILPFTYFLFYQYGIVNRCYSVLCFAVFLTAYLYKTRNERPFRYTFALCLMSLSSAYGLITAFGLALLWSAQIIKEKGIKNFLSDIFQDKRTQGLFILAAVGIIIAAEIFPAKNTVATNNIVSVDYITKLLYAFFSIPADTLITNISGLSENQIYYYDFHDLLKLYNIKEFDVLIKEYWLSVLIGFIINIILFRIFKNLRQLPLYFCCMFPFLIVCYALYVCEHHIGIYVLLLILVFWIACEVLENNFKINKVWQYLLNIFLIFQLLWTYLACSNDILYNYSFGRDVTKYLKENKLENYKIMSGWFVDKKLLDNTSRKNFFDVEKHANPVRITRQAPNMQVIPVSINQYFNRNIFYTFDILFPGKQYILLGKLTDDEIADFFKKIQNQQAPDVIVGEVEIQNKDEMYDLAKIVEYGKIFKNIRIVSKLPIYVKKDIAGRQKND